MAYPNTSPDACRRPAMEDYLQKLTNFKAVLETSPVGGCNVTTTYAAMSDAKLDEAHGAAKTTLARWESLHNSTAAFQKHVNSANDTFDTTQRRAIAEYNTQLMLRRDLGAAMALYTIAKHAQTIYAGHQNMVTSAGRLMVDVDQKHALVRDAADDIMTEICRREQEFAEILQADTTLEAQCCDQVAQRPWSKEIYGW